MTKAQIRKLDALAGTITRQRGSCQKCHTTETLQAAHIIGRKIHATAWQQANLLCLCARCHAMFHDRPLEFSAFVNGLLGVDHADRLNRLSKVLAPDIKPRLTYDEVVRMLDDDLDTWEKRIFSKEG